MKDYIAAMFHTLTCPTCRKYIGRKSRRTRQPVYFSNRIRIQARENQIRLVQKAARRKNLIHNFQEILAFIMFLFSIGMVMVLVILFS